jgi:hypothetical protein
MTKQFFNDPEAYVLQNWKDASLLEETMNEVRNKYEQIFDKVLDKVQNVHSELEYPAKHFDINGDYSIHVGIGKKSWPFVSKGWPSGLWFGNILLEHLMGDEDYDQPCKVIWINPPKELGINLNNAIKEIQKAADNILDKEDMKATKVHFYGKTQGWISYPMRDSRQSLLELLLKDNAEGFIDKMVEYYEELTQFIPVMNKLFEPIRNENKSAVIPT